MSDPKKLTDLQRNWNIAKLYVKESPSLPNILKALKYLLDGPSKYLTGLYESKAVKLGTFTFQSPRIPVGNATYVGN